MSAQSLKKTLEQLCQPSEENYFYQRGLSTKLQRQYLLGGHQEGMNHLINIHYTILSEENANKYTRAYQYFFPIFDLDGDVTYFLSRINEDAAPGDMDLKNKFRNLTGKAIRLFNDRYLLDPTLVKSSLFICEGVFDALSFEEMGYQAMALNSTANVSKFKELLAADKCSHITFVIAGDNDDAGWKMQSELTHFFSELNIKHDSFITPSKYNDVNEFLISDRKRFEFTVARVISTLGAPHSTIRYMEDFLDQIKSNQSLKPIDTGFKRLNESLGGGIFPGLYVIGAISSLGKTTFSLQIADYIAGTGTDVLFFSLEMSKFEIVAKSLSSKTGALAREMNSAVGASLREIIQGEASPSILSKAYTRYAPAALHMNIIEGNFDTDTKLIRSCIENHITTRKVNPVIVIDYLQILLPESDRLSDKQAVDRNVTILKRISREFNLPVILISSFNRENYSSPVGYQSFKESGCIEYGADVIVGLQLEAIHQAKEQKHAHERQKLLDEAKRELPRKVELIILKNRNGTPWARVRFNYYAEFNFFEEAER